jgi:hypothetical protein
MKYKKVGQEPELINHATLIEKMMEQRGGTFEFQVERVPEPGKTFSAEAIEGLQENIGLYIGTRIKRRWDEQGEADWKPGPSKINVIVTVVVDDIPFEAIALNEQPWFSTIDGRHRSKTRN